MGLVQFHVLRFHWEPNISFVSQSIFGVIQDAVTQHFLWHCKPALEVILSIPVPLCHLFQKRKKKIIFDLGHSCDTVYSTAWQRAVVFTKLREQQIPVFLRGWGKKHLVCQEQLKRTCNTHHETTTSILLWDLWDFMVYNSWQTLFSAWIHTYFP